MLPKNHTRVLFCGATLAAVLLSSAAGVSAQVPERPKLGAGEVTATDVYLRSGPSLNHYVVAKLAAGDRVTVLSERGDWYEIVPPAGSFSLISGDYVLTDDEKTGTITGNNVRVRTGSQLNDNKYTVQTMLSKGASVTILGRNADGFLRIAPPASATVWVNRQFVEMVPAGLAALESELAAPSDVLPAVETSGVGKTPVASATPAPSSANPKITAKVPSPFANLPKTEHRVELERIDAATRVELSKPVSERKLAPLIDLYGVIAAQKKDGFAQRYAAARVTQLTDMDSMIQAVRQLRKLSAEAESTRRGLLKGRAKLREAMPPIPAGLDVEGVLKVSAVYPPGSIPERYRLVASGDATLRTIGYIEIPAGSGLKVTDLLGSLVGVRASSKRLQAGGVDPVPIYVASEIVSLADDKPAPAAAGR